jgi:hypothetical protein
MNMTTEFVRGPAARCLSAGLALTLVASCGGTGGDESPAGTNNLPAALSAADMAVAQRLYAANERTPPGFAVEPRPANVTGLVSTRHLKSTDVDPLGGNAPRHFELCSNDLAQALGWSESVAQWNGLYSDLAEVNGNARFMEFARVPRADLTALLRHRVYRCDFLDRSSIDLRSEQGDAGFYRATPLDSAALGALAEYLWQFTAYNNSDYVVVSSAAGAASASGEMAHTIRLAQLIRSTASSCDTVHINDWTHFADAGTGALRRTLTAVRSFGVRNKTAGPEACAP